jgi:preprotein translocase subunit Sec61beta
MNEPTPPPIIDPLAVLYCGLTVLVVVLVLVFGS